MKKFYFVWFLAGMFFGATLLGGFIIVKEAGDRFAASVGTVIFSDKDVREAILREGIALPDGARDLYFAESGFQDRCCWIKMTVPKEKLWSLVGENLKVTRADFKQRAALHLLKEVHQNRDGSLDVSWWRPSEVKMPYSYSLDVFK